MKKSPERGSFFLLSFDDFSSTEDTMRVDGSSDTRTIVPITEMKESVVTRMGAERRLIVATGIREHTDRSANRRREERLKISANGLIEHREHFEDHLDSPLFEVLLCESDNFANTKTRSFIIQPLRPSQLATAAEFNHFHLGEQMALTGFNKRRNASKATIVEAGHSGGNAVYDNSIVGKYLVTVFIKVTGPEAGATRHSNELRKTTIIYGFSILIFFCAIARDIRGRVEVDIADGMVTMRPQLRQYSGRIEIIFSPRSDKFPIIKVRIEQQHVVMGSLSS